MKTLKYPIVANLILDNLIISAYHNVETFTRLYMKDQLYYYNYRHNNISEVFKKNAVTIETMRTLLDQ
jgi:predicted membrane-bound dolichyl-phosphate-mannose-protein mannosyltransferase